MAEVSSVTGAEGNFEVQVHQKPRYIDMDKCTACGLCAEKCPKKVKDPYNEGLSMRKAAYVQYPQAVPLRYVIDEENCIFFQKGKCRACEKFCPNQAVNFAEKPKDLTLKVGSIILAAGFNCFDPTAYETYAYSKMPNVITSIEFERILSPSGPSMGHLVRPSEAQNPQKKEIKKIAWVQCVGSRDVNHCDHGYCSAVCCMYALKEAMVAQEHSKSGLDCTVFYMDIRSYGKDYERYYNRAKDQGIRFVRSRIHTFDPVPGTDDVQITYVTEKGDVVNEEF